MRAFIGRLLMNDGPLNALGINRQSVIAGNADTPEPRPYVVIRWQDTQPGVDVSRLRNVVFWVHDTGNDYARIDAIIARIRALMEGTAAVRTDVGWITTVDWTGDSADLDDDATRTIMRTTSYAVVGSGI